MGSKIEMSCGVGVKLSLLVIVCLAGLSLSDGRLLGAQKCTWGPSYWCGSLGKAKECSAVQHCVGAVWHGLDLPADNDEICELCKGFVIDAENQTAVSINFGSVLISDR